MRLKIVLTTILLISGTPLFSQVAPARERGLPIAIGVGFSDFDTDWSGRERGTTVWVDWNFYSAPSLLKGLGLEVEGRDLSYGRSGSDPNLRLDTVGGGPIYTWRRFQKVHPYGKFLINYGSIDFTSSDPDYKHDTRTVYTPGVGVKYKAFRNIWLRGDYEYQFWTDFFHHNALNPEGFTIGASFDFRHIHSR